MSLGIPGPGPRIPVVVNKIADKFILRVNKNGWMCEVITSEARLKTHKHPWLVPEIWAWFRDVAEKLEVSPLEVIQATEDLIHEKRSSLEAL